MQDLIDEGHAAIQLVNQLHDAVVEDEDLSDKQKSIITEKLAVSFEQQLVRLWRTTFWVPKLTFLIPFVGSG